MRRCRIYQLNLLPLNYQTGTNYCRLNFGILNNHIPLLYVLSYPALTSYL